MGIEELVRLNARLHDPANRIRRQSANRARDGSILGPSSRRSQVSSLCLPPTNDIFKFHEEVHVKGRRNKDGTYSGI